MEDIIQPENRFLKLGQKLKFSCGFATSFGDGLGAQSPNIDFHLIDRVPTPEGEESGAIQNLSIGISLMLTSAYILF